jgi:hypothetical protein
MVSKRAMKSAYIPTDFSQVPTELRELSQWICWRFAERDGKETKLPVSPETGVEVAVTDAAKWVSFERAVDRAGVRNDIDGIGFAFRDGGGLVGIDLDDCLTGGQLSEFARGVVHRFPGTYAEVSPSGEGLKLWVRGEVPVAPDKTGRKIPKRGLEVYCRGRYFTVTGRRWIDESSGRHADSEPAIVNFGEAVAEWFREMFPEKSAADAAGREQKASPAVQPPDVGEIVRRACEARNGEKFRQLFDGDLSGYSDDHSSADQALCNMLAFWCGCDAGLMDLVFRASGLMREKWERADYRESTIAKAIESCRETYQGSQGVVSTERVNPPQAWEPLIPITAPEPPEILPEDLPFPLSQFVGELMTAGETPGAMAVMGVLGMLAVCCQKKFRVQNDGRHSEPLSLYLLSAAKSGERKSSVMSKAREPLSLWERQEANRMQPEIAEATSRRKADESRVEYLRKKAAKEPNAEKREKVMGEILQIERELPAVPVAPCLTTSDATLEALAPHMERQGERMAVVSDEGGIFEILAGIYSNGQPKLDLALQGFDGGEVRIVRAMGREVNLRNPALSFVLFTQPEVLEKACRNPAFRGRGLVQRFLFVVPSQRIGFRQLPDDSPGVSEGIKKTWESIVLRLLDEKQSKNDFGEPIARMIRLDRGAFRVWKDYQRELEPLMRPGGRWHFETGWCSKFPGAVARIAGLLHCALAAHGHCGPDAVPMSESTMHMAVSLGRKLEQHALKAFGVAGMNDVEKLAAKIAGWLQEKQATGVSRRDIQRGPCSGLSREAMNDALDLLADNHWLRVRAAKAGVVGRPPEEFDVNPEVRKQSDDINRTPEGDGVVRVSSVLSEGSGILTTNRTAEGGDLSILSAGSGSEWSQFDDALPMEGGAV